MNRFSLGLVLFIFSVATNAQGFDYSFLQLNYSKVDFDDINIDGDGFGLSGSYALDPDWHVFGAYQGLGFDFGVDATAISGGVGYNTEMSRNVDLFARLSYQYVDLDPAGPGNFDDNGFGFGVGMRYAASRELELNAALEYVDFGDSGDTGFSAGALYNYSSAVAFGLEGNWSDDTSSFTLSGRFYFGR